MPTPIDVTFSLSSRLPTLSIANPLPKIAVLASGTGSNFLAILDAVAKGTLSAQVVGLLSNVADAGCLQIASRYGVPSQVRSHVEAPNREAFDRQVAQALSAWQPDLVVMAGWMRIATPALIEAFPGRITNLHPSLLPAFRGLHAIEQAYQAGVTITGCTVHLVTESLDDGPIIGQASLPIHHDESLEALTARIHKAEHILYARALQHLIDGSSRS